MRLSDIKGERTLEVVADLIEPVASLASDPATSALFKKQTVADVEAAKVVMLDRIKASLPVLLRTHKRDIIKILSTLDGKTEAEYCESLNMPRLIKDCLDLLTDDAFMGVFTSAQNQNSSGAAQENT